MKKIFSVPLLIVLLFVTITFTIIFISCDQAPIFYNISIAPPKKDPLIPGSPTNIIHHGNALYTGSKFDNRIFHNTGGKWQQIKRPGGSLLNLASDGTYLYALTYKGDVMKSTSVRRFDGTNWEAFQFPGYSMQTIYGAGDRIFVGAKQNNANNYAILEVIVKIVDSNEVHALRMIKPNTSLLRGAVEVSPDKYFLATSGDGILEYDYDENPDEPELVEGTASAIVLGIIKTADTGVIIAVISNTSGQGGLYVYNGTDEFERTISSSTNFTGAMGVFKEFDDVANTWNPSLLLLGVRGDNNKGYREIWLNTDGTITDPSPSPIIKTPGDNKTKSSVSSRVKYDASIAKHSVEAIIQGPWEIFDPGKTGITLPLFASTIDGGLWSYRGEWNAEEK